MDKLPALFADDLVRRSRWVPPSSWTAQVVHPLAMFQTSCRVAQGARPRLPSFPPDPRGPTVA
eukprot:8982691-Pyramimonas_sp.AAC.1